MRSPNPLLLSWMLGARFWKPEVPRVFHLFLEHLVDLRVVVVSSGWPSFSLALFLLRLASLLPAATPTGSF